MTISSSTSEQGRKNSIPVPIPITSIRVGRSISFGPSIFIFTFPVGQGRGFGEGCPFPASCLEFRVSIDIHHHARWISFPLFFRTTCLFSFRSTRILRWDLSRARVSELNYDDGPQVRAGYYFLPIYFQSFDFGSHWTALGTSSSGGRHFSVMKLPWHKWNWRARYCNQYWWRFHPSWANKKKLLQIEFFLTIKHLSKFLHVSPWSNFRLSFSILKLLESQLGHPT